MQKNELEAKWDEKKKEKSKTECKLHWSYLVSENSEIRDIIKKESVFDFEALGLVLVAWLIVSVLCCIH